MFETLKQMNWLYNQAKFTLKIKKTLISFLYPIDKLIIYLAAFISSVSFYAICLNILSSISISFIYANPLSMVYASVHFMIFANIYIEHFYFKLEYINVRYLYNQCKQTLISVLFLYSTYQSLILKNFNIPNTILVLLSSIYMIKQYKSNPKKLIPVITHLAFMVLTMTVILPTYHEWLHVLSVVFPHYHISNLKSISSITTFSFLMLFYDRFNEVTLHWTQMANSFDYKDLLGFFVVLLSCNYIGVIKLPYQTSLLVLTLTTIVFFSNELVNLYHTHIQLINNTYRTILNALNKPVSMSIQSQLNHVFTYISNLSLITDSSLNKIFLHLHLILETAFAYAGSKQLYTLFLGYLSEWVIDVSSMPTDNEKMNDLSIKPSKMNNLLLLSMITSIIMFSFGFVISSIAIPALSWLYAHDYFSSNPQNMFSHIKNIVTNHSMLIICSIASLLQGFNTAMELKLPGKNSFNRSFMTLASIATFIIEGRVYHDLSKDFVKNFSSKPSNNMKPKNDRISHEEPINPTQFILKNYFY